MNIEHRTLNVQHRIMNSVNLRKRLSNIRRTHRASAGAAGAPALHERIYTSKLSVFRSRLQSGSLVLKSIKRSVINIGRSMLDVGRSMLDVGRSMFNLFSLFRPGGVSYESSCSIRSIFILTLNGYSQYLTASALSQACPPARKSVRRSVWKL